MQRDPKGLYRKAIAGELPNFTGISDPYEPPISPELELHGDEKGPEQLAADIVTYLASNRLIST
jgi:adenylylsulfate kinase-like enzyme